MHTLANMRSKICIKGRLIINSKFVTIWVVTRGGGGSRQTVTKSDKGGEGGSKIGDMPVTYFLNGPVNEPNACINMLHTLLNNKASYLRNTSAF